MSQIKVMTPKQRTMLFLSAPASWNLWPFLPLVRRCKGEEELGVVYDALHNSGKTGYSGTVFLTNLFTIPEYEKDFLALPRETYDTPEEIVSAGWTVD